MCAWIRPTPNQIDVLVLQHPTEQHHAKGTLRLLEMSLSHCQRLVGEQFDALTLGAWLSSGTALLYPRPASATTSAPVAEPALPCRRLVVLDGTWRQSRKLLHLNPCLQMLPRCVLDRPPPGQYRIRKSQRNLQRSTLEATCLALGDLEARPAHYAPLLLAFEGWMAALESRQNWGSGPTRPSGSAA